MSDTPRERLPDRLVWVDLETTGLDPKSDRVLEVAMVVTDPNLVELSSCDLLIGSVYDVDFLRGCDPFVVDMHTRNGLIDALVAADIEDRFEVRDRWDTAFDWLAINGFGPGGVYLAGNSVHFDRAFLLAADNRFADILHHRQVDVSSFKVLYELVAGRKGAKPESNHRAMGDVRSSIEELRPYLKLFQKEFTT